MRARRYIRQNIKITTLGNGHAEECISQIEAIFVKLGSRLPDGAMEPWQPAVHDNFPAIEANARYFTPASAASSQDIVEFAPFVDPTGQLSNLMEGDYVHTTDNRVEFMESVAACDGRIQ